MHVITHVSRICPRKGFYGASEDVLRSCDVMDLERLRELLAGFKGGQINLDETLERLRHLPFEDLGYARVDHHRSLRQGFPEVIFGQGKTPEQIAGIVARQLDRAANLLI